MHANSFVLELTQQTPLDFCTFLWTQCRAQYETTCLVLLIQGYTGYRYSKNKNSRETDNAARIRSIRSSPGMNLNNVLTMESGAAVTELQNRNGALELRFLLQQIGCVYYTPSTRLRCCRYSWSAILAQPPTSARALTKLS